MNRRRFLSDLGVALVASGAGCVSRTDSGGNSQGTEELPIRFWLKEVSLSASEHESITPIVFENLSIGEREIVRTALEEEEYTVDPESTSPPLEDLRDRIEQQTGDGETLEAYLRREVTYYRVGFADGDHILAHPDH
jgi:hypothetical protein